MASDEELGSGSVTIVLDSDAAEGDAQRLGDRIEAILARAARDAGLRMQREIRRAVRAISPVQIRVEADARPFGHTIDTLRNFDAVRIRVEPDLADFAERIRTALAGEEFPITVVPDFYQFDAAIRAHNAPPVTVDVNADVDRGLSQALSNIGGALAGVGRAATAALGIGALGIAAAGAAQGVFALTAALAPAAGIVAALPAVALGAQAALGALRLALSGVGEAFSAALTGDAAAFEKSLKGLSPAAQDAAREVRALKPAFEGLRSSVQDEFFSQFEGGITRAAANLGGPLKSGLTAISNEFGRAAAQALNFLASTDAAAGLTTLLGGTQGALTGLSTAMQPVLKGVLDIAAAVADAFGPQVGASIGQAGAQFGTWLSGLAASGRAVELVRNAVEVFAQLGSIAGNVGGIISGVFRAANDVGGGLLNNLSEITGRFREFVDSAQGQEAIGNIFRTLSTVAAQLSPILAALVTQLGGIAPALAPLFTAIGPAITGIINAIGPAIQNLLPGVQTLVSALAEGIGNISSSGAFEALGTAIGSVATAIAPLLPVIGELIGSLVTALAPAVTQIATAIGPVVEAFAGALAPVIPQITSAISTLVVAFSPLITLLGSTLASLLPALTPLFSVLANVFQQVATALVPIIAQLTAQFAPVIARMVPLIAQLVASLAPLVQQLVAALLPVLPPIIEAFTAIQLAVIQVLPPLIQLAAALAPFVSLIISALAPVIQFAAEVIKWIALNAVVPVISLVVSTITSIIGAVTSVLGAVQGFVTSVVGFFVSLRGSVVGSVSGLVSSVVGFFLALPGRARSAVSGIVGAVVGVFKNMASSAGSTISSFITSAVKTIGGLIGRAKSALSGAATALVSAGKDLILGMINGVKSQAGALVSAAKGVVSGAVDGAKSLLGISSPSKVFKEIGRDTGRGFIIGLTGTASEIKQATDKITRQIRDAFEGRNTRLDDRLIAQVRATSKQLVKLADQREAIAEKIKKANELAASVTQNALQSFSLQNLASRGGGIQGLTDGIDSAINQIRKFNTQINALAKRGLRRDLLSQIVGLGPEQGAALASTLASATDAQLDDLNEAQRQLAAAGKKLGRDSADALYDSGVNAGRGFLEGLKSQQKQIERVMTDIARVLARTVRKELGIRSPSTVFRRIGVQTMDGLSLGVDRRLSAVSRSAVRATSALTDPFGGAAAPRLGGRFSGAADGTVTNSASTTRTIAPVFHLTEVGDAEVTAQRIVNRLAMVGGGL